MFTSILRQELTEEVTELNQITGEFVTIEKKPSIAEVIKAGSELMKRYPTKLELQKLKLEIEKLQSQVGGSEGHWFEPSCSCYGHTFVWLFILDWR